MKDFNVSQSFIDVSKLCASFTYVLTILNLFPRSWRDNIKLVNTERIKIENKEYHTDFTIVNAVRRDTGKYKLRAENCNGFDEETVELTVLSKPSAPKGEFALYFLEVLYGLFR